MADYFSIMPVEIFADDRLTKTDLRVLGAIMSWRNKTTNLCHPSREQISERCGLPLCKISTATAHLVELGWLEKRGNGGRSTHCVYKFCIPETVTDSETVTNSVTVTDSVIKTVTDLVTKTVTDSVRGKKLKDNLNITKINTKEKINKKEKVDPIREELSEVTNQTFDDFIQLRKAKRSPLTLRAIQGIRNEANKAGIPLETALIECCTRGWVGFKAEWYVKPQAPPQLSKQQIAHIAARSIFGNNEEVLIHGEVIEHESTTKQLG